MERITLYDKTFRTFIPFERIDAAIAQVAAQLNADFREEDRPIFLGILNGSFMFMADLLKKIDLNAESLFVKVSSYQGTSSTGTVQEVIGLNANIEGRTVILVEDIVDSGKTIVKLSHMLQEKKPKQVAICTLFYKPNAYKESLPINYRGLEIGNEFIVGYGLDYNGLGRQYRDIYILDE